MPPHLPERDPRRSDIALMLALQAGCLDAFDEIARRWRKPLLGFFYPLTWNMDDAEDCVQATLLRLWRARERYTPSARFSTYLFQIARRYWLNERSRRRVPQVALDSAPALPGLTFRDFDHPVGHLLSRYRNERVRRAIAALPEAQRLALILCHFQGMSHAEAADVLDVPIGTLKSRMAAAFAHLRRALGDLLEEG